MPVWPFVRQKTNVIGGQHCTGKEKEQAKAWDRRRREHRRKVHGTDGKGAAVTRGRAGENVLATPWGHVRRGLSVCLWLKICEGEVGWAHGWIVSCSVLDREESEPMCRFSFFPRGKKRGCGFTVPFPGQLSWFMPSSPHRFASSVIPVRIHSHAGLRPQSRQSASTITPVCIHCHAGIGGQGMAGEEHGRDGKDAALGEMHGHGKARHCRKRGGIDGRGMVLAERC